MSNNPNIARLVNKYDYGYVLQLICQMIADAISNINVNNNMTAEQVKECARKLMGDYHTYKLDDFYKCLSTGITGKFNPEGFYRIDISVIFGWFRIYDMDRDGAIIKKRVEQASQAKERAVLNGLDGVKLPEVKKVDSEVVYYEDQKWINDFDALWEKQGCAKGIKTVLIDNKNMDLTEYLQYRAKK